MFLVACARHFNLDVPQPANYLLFDVSKGSGNDSSLNLIPQVLGPWKKRGKTTEEMKALDGSSEDEL